MDAGETGGAFLDGWNRAHFGLTNAGFLADEATGTDPAAHPYVYTHHGNVARYVSYLFTLVGLDQIPIQLLFAMAITVIGFVFGYLFVKRLLGRTTALLIVLLAGTSYLGVLQWGPNLLRSWNFLVFFGAFYFTLRWRQDRANWTLIPVALCVLWIVLSDLSFAIAYLSALFFFVVIGQRSVRAILVGVSFIAVPTVLGLGVYLLVLTRELGWDTLLADLRYTYTIRNLTDQLATNQGSVYVDEFFAQFRASDVPFLEEARRFFADHHLEFWVLSGGSTNVLTVFFDILRKYGVQANGPLWYVSTVALAMSLFVGCIQWLRRQGGWRPDMVVVSIALIVLAGARLLLSNTRDPLLLGLWLVIALTAGRPIARIVGRFGHAHGRWSPRQVPRQVPRQPAKVEIAEWRGSRRAQRGIGLLFGGAATLALLILLSSSALVQDVFDQVGLAADVRPYVRAGVAIALALVGWAYIELVAPLLVRRLKLPTSDSERGLLSLTIGTLTEAPDPAGFLVYTTAFALGLVATLTIMGGYLTTFTMVPYRTLLVFVDLVMLALVGTALLRILRYGRPIARVGAAACLAVASYAWVSTQVTNIGTIRPVELASGPTLAQQYRGKTFVSTLSAPWVFYYTREWALNVTYPGAPRVFSPDQVYDALFPFQADYWSNPTKYERPEYYLCDSTPARANSPEVPDAAPDFCAQRARDMAAMGHVPEVIGDYFAIVRLTYPE